MANVKKLAKPKEKKKLEPFIGPEPEHWKNMSQIEIIDEIIMRILQIPPPCH